MSTIKNLIFLVLWVAFLVVAFAAMHRYAPHTVSTVVDWATGNG